MTDPIQAMMAEGDFDGAAAQVEARLSSGYDPGLGIQLFGIHIYRDDPDRAEAVLRDVMSRTPEVQPTELLANLSAVRTFLRRRHDPGVAGQRNLVLSQPNTAPQPWLAELIKASVEHASGQHDAAAASLASSRAATPAVSGVAKLARGGERRFSEIRDSDDLTGATLAAFSGPHLLDIPFSEVRGFAFLERGASWDWVWMPAAVALRDGRQFEARIPARYPGTAKHPDASVRLSRMTLWDRDHGYGVAVGMVDLMLDGAMVGIENVQAVQFD